MLAELGSGRPDEGEGEGEGFNSLRLKFVKTDPLALEDVGREGGASRVSGWAMLFRFEGGGGSFRRGYLPPRSASVARSR